MALLQALLTEARRRQRRSTRREQGGRMTKITPEHLARQAFVYIRQSTADQVSHNHESQRRQYGLPQRARQLGWSTSR